jgi:hypothetical protein
VFLAVIFGGRGQGAFAFDADSGFHAAGVFFFLALVFGFQVFSAVGFGIRGQRAVAFDADPGCLFAVVCFFLVLFASV